MSQIAAMIKMTQQNSINIIQQSNLHSNNHNSYFCRDECCDASSYYELCTQRNLVFCDKKGKLILPKKKKFKHKISDVIERI